MRLWIIDIQDYFVRENVQDTICKQLQQGSTSPIQLYSSSSYQVSRGYTFRGIGIGSESIDSDCIASECIASGSIPSGCIPLNLYRKMVYFFSALRPHPSRMAGLRWSHGQYREEEAP